MPEDILLEGREMSVPVSLSLVHVSKLRFSFALDLKSELKKGFSNVLNILLGKLVGTGSIEISRTVLPGWDPE
jgi:hypothetical protein